MGDAAHAILTRDRSFTGHFLIDDEVLAGADLDAYAVRPGSELQPDLFV